jgi:hypothetical protein
MTDPRIPTEFACRETIANDVVFVDGCMRSGKHMLGTVISSFERMEMWQNLVLVENLPVYHALGAISRDAAVQMMQIEIDTHFYYTLIGRRVNFRYNDASGVWKSRDPREYFSRIFSDDEGEVLDRLPETRPIGLLFTHDVLSHPEIPFEAYPAIRFVEMRRNPVDVAHSWLRKNWPERMVSDPMSTGPAIGRTDSVPWFAADWSETYPHINSTDRTIRSLETLNQRRDAAFAQLEDEQSRRVFSVPFEAFVVDPDPWIERLSGFLGTQPSEQTTEILRRERCPRTLPKSDYANKRNELVAELDSLGIERLNRLEDDYRDWCRTHHGVDDNEIRI